MRTLELDGETRQLLARIRSGTEALLLDDVDSDLAEQAVWELGRPLLDAARISGLACDQYRWFLRELAGLLRTRLGWDLAFELELLLRKWVGYGLELGLLQALIRQCYSGLIAPPPRMNPQITQITPIGSEREPPESAKSAESADVKSGVHNG